MSFPAPAAAATGHRTTLRLGPLAVATVPLAVGLIAFDAALDGFGLPLLAAALVLGLLGGQRAGRVAALTAAAAIAVAAAGRLHVRWEAEHAAERADGRIASRLRDLERRQAELVERVRGLGSRAAALPDSRPALAQDRGALVRLFRGLENLRDDVPDRPAVAVHSVPSLAVVAWSGRIGDPPVPTETMKGGDRVFVLEGSVSTTLVAITAIKAPGGALLGLVTTALPVAVRRNIDNEYLHDFDLLTGEDPRVEAVYVDVRRDAATSSDLPPLDPALRAREALLRGPGGDPLALVRVAAPGAPEIREVLESRYRRMVAALAAAALLLWAARAASRPWRVALAAAGVRALWALLGPPWLAPMAPLLFPDVYASPLLGPLSRSALDLLLTAAAALVVALCALTAARRRPLAPRPFVVAAALVAGALVVAGVSRLVADTVARSAIDLETVTLVPPSLAHAVLQLALLACVLAGLVLLAACLRWAGLWPRPLAALDTRPAGARAGALLGLVALAGALLQLSLVGLGQRRLQQRIASEEAPLVLRQPEFRELVLKETQKRIDSLRILGDVPSERGRPGIEELAFAVWTSTDLAARGFSSAIEIQDADGAVISRFALNLPSLSSRPLPSNETWRTSREPSSLASTARTVLHARRLLTEDGQVRGAVHVYVADDFWNLPFLRTSDPYSLLFRPAPRAPEREDPLVMIAYGRGRDVVFSSVERTPPLPTALAAQLVPEGPGLWTILSVDGQSHHAYLFAGREDVVYALAYPRISWGRRAGDLVEAVAACTLVALLGLVAAVLVRTALRRRVLSLTSILYAVQRRFALRLVVAFTVLAVAPVVVLQVVVGKFVSDRLWEEANKQGLERVSVARKAVEDFVFFQRGEPAGAEPVTDAALVWVASLIRNDLAVFEGGRLAASSKRELYASGLLAPRLSGSVYRILVLEGYPSTLRTERIGGFAYLVASMPVRTADNSEGVLSLPLASRQREVEATVRDLDRTIRLASLVFLGLAALFAQQVARRISGPISALTSATRRIAEGDLATRVQATSRDELMTLVESFNQMAGDLDRQRRDLERSNRLATWADMARQVAHEVKNPLTPIQLSAEHLRRVWRDRRVDFEGALEACTATILKQVRILRGIVTEFSAFARPPAAVLEPQDPARLMSDVIEPYRIALPPGVTLSVRSEGPLPVVLGDRRLLERALVNLLENALQAVAEHGSIEVGLRSADSGGRVELWVQDSGPGIDPELAERIFEPFFSTKTGGSGLGLPLVRKIAEDHGGGVSLSRPAEGGTRATLWLPARTQGHAA